MGLEFCDAEAWACAQFSDSELGDARRTRRLVRVAASLLKKPSGTLPGSFLSGAELRGAYRLFAGEESAFEDIASPHWKRTRAACLSSGDVLMIEDLTLLDYSSHPQTAGLGHVGDGRGLGLMLHTTLAVRIEDWSAQQEPDVSIAGLLHQKVWTRSHPPRKATESRSDRARRERESNCWAEAFAQGGPPQGVRWTFMADREADIFDTIVGCRASGVEVLVRANHDRKTDGVETLFSTVAKAQPRGRFELDLRARPGTSARVACLELRAASVTVKAPWRAKASGKEEVQTLPLNVVEVREVDPPEGRKPLRWMLVTTWRVDSFEDCLRVARAYTKRWLVEEYHKALKTGALVEESQLTTAARLQALLGVLSVVAVRLLAAKLLAEKDADREIDAEDVGVDLLQIMELSLGRPKGGWTHANVLKSIARFGGFMGRKSDGMPGWQTLWKGWHTLQILLQGFLLARRE